MEPNKRAELIDAMSADNPKTPRTMIIIYVDHLIMYIEAVKSIHSQGPVVADPRSGRPMQNPYMKDLKQICAAMMKAGKYIPNKKRADDAMIGIDTEKKS